jgi:hypothetical protein
MPYDYVAELTQVHVSGNAHEQVLVLAQPS